FGCLEHDMPPGTAVLHWTELDVAHCAERCLQSAARGADQLFDRLRLGSVKGAEGFGLRGDMLDRQARVLISRIARFAGVEESGRHREQDARQSAHHIFVTGQKQRYETVRKV